MTDDLPPRPGWLALGARVERAGERFGIAGIRAAADGAGWEVMGTRTASEWYPARELLPIKGPPAGYRPWGRGAGEQA